MSKNITVEFYMLFNDHTWDTTFIDVPRHLGDENSMVDWALKNEEFGDNVWKIGVYSIQPDEEN